MALRGARSVELRVSARVASARGGSGCLSLSVALLASGAGGFRAVAAVLRTDDV